MAIKDRRRAASSRDLTRDQAATLPLGQGRIWMISENAPLFPIPKADQVDGALEAIRARTQLLRSEQTKGHLLEIRELRE